MRKKDIQNWRGEMINHQKLAEPRKRQKQNTNKGELIKLNKKLNRAQVGR